LQHLLQSPPAVALPRIIELLPWLLEVVVSSGHYTIFPRCVSMLAGSPEIEMEGRPTTKRGRDMGRNYVARIRAT
jgi:hypothetical protein